MESTLPVLRLLASSSVCRGLSDAEVQGLLAICELRHLPADTPLFKEGVLADALYVIVDGKVRITKRHHVLATLEPGGVIGELSLFRNGHLRSASAAAVCPATVLRLPTPAFQKLLARHDVAALKVVNNVAHQMADRIISLNERVVNEGGRKGLSEARTALGTITT